MPLPGRHAVSRTATILRFILHFFDVYDETLFLGHNDKWWFKKQNKTSSYTATFVQRLSVSLTVVIKADLFCSSL